MRRIIRFTLSFYSLSLDGGKNKTSKAKSKKKKPKSEERTTTTLSPTKRLPEPLPEYDVAGLGNELPLGEYDGNNDTVPITDEDETTDFPEEVEEQILKLRRNKVIL
jgi:hypothetical protein